MVNISRLSKIIGIISLCIFLLMTSTYDASAQVDDKMSEKLKHGVVKISANETGAGIVIGIKNDIIHVLTAYHLFGENTLFSVNLAFQNELDENRISDDLRQKFREEGITLSRNVKVSVKKDNIEWLITDEDNDQKKYLVKKGYEELKISKVADTEVEFYEITNRNFNGVVEIANPELDIAVIRVHSEQDDISRLHIPKIPCEYASEPKKEDKVFFIGHPGDDKWFCSNSSKSIEESIPDINPLFFSFTKDSQFEEGCSGGPVFNKKGHLIGMNTAYESKYVAAIKINEDMINMFHEYRIQTNNIVPINNSFWKALAYGIIPGGGQYYNNDKAKGLTFELIVGGSIAFLGYFEAQRKQAVDATRDLRNAGCIPESKVWSTKSKDFKTNRNISVGTAVIIWIFSMIDAISKARS